MGNAKKYSLKHLLNSKYFEGAILHNDIKAQQFWEDAIIQGRLDESTYNIAKDILSKAYDSDLLSKFIDSRTPLIWNRLEKNIQVKRKKLYLTLTSIAAIAAILIFTIFHFTHNQPANTLITEQVIDAFDYSTDEIQLIISGEKIAIAGDVAEVDHRNSDNIVVNNSQIITQERETQRTAQNHLVVPHGKRSQLTLPDGSKIWVNAASHLSYPSKFEKNKRVIYLDGEIYGDIMHNPSSPFTIITNNIEVSVLGTSLNIQAYSDDDMQTVVLVEGLVSVKDKTKQAQLLSPNEMFFTSELQRGVKKVDVENYISWKKGYHKFKSEKLGIILKRISKYYGIKIECDSSAYSLRCTGGLDYKDDFYSILDGICLSAPVSYIKNNDVYNFSINL